MEACIQELNRTWLTCKNKYKMYLKKTKDSIKRLVELWALRGLKNVDGLIRWLYGIIFVQVFITKFQQVQMKEVIAITS